MYSLKTALQSVIVTQHSPADLFITYNNMHGLWGGSIFNVRRNGHLERQTKSLGAATTKVTQKKIGEQDLVELVRLLVELTAWEQRNLNSQPIPGESRAQLTISIQGSTSRLWR